MLTPPMITLIENHTAGMVATVNTDGTPAVSPKATFVVLDPATLAFGHIRSPGTVANLERTPAVEIVFLDVLSRRAVRVAGRASVVPRGAADTTLREAFEARWAEYVPHMSAFVLIDVTRASVVTSPAYDLGHDEAELRASNLERLAAL